MKKKLLKIANQIYSLEQKCQAGDNVLENIDKMEKLIESISPEELFEIDEYLEKKMNFKFFETPLK